jgi:hypothetical protein
MNVPSPPQPPDPSATAATQMGANVGSAEATTLMNQVNQVGPYGGLNYTQRGTQTVKTPLGNFDVPQFTATQWYTPTGEQELKYQEATGLNIGEAGQALSGQIANTLANPIQLPGTPDLSNESVDKQLYSEYAPMMNYELGNQKAQLESQLQAQGATPGSSAYNNAMTLFNNNAQQAWNSMYMAGRGEATSEMQQNYQNRLNQAMTAYNQPMQTVATLMGMGAPQSQPLTTTPSANIAPANYEQDVNQAYQNEMQAYKEQVANQSATMGGIFGTAGTIGSALMSKFLPSDERLKEGPDGGEPVKVGELDNELPVYAYRFKDGGPTQIGLLAQEVEKMHPEAVAYDRAGLRHVDYGRAVMPMGGAFGRAEGRRMPMGGAFGMRG